MVDVGNKKELGIYGRLAAIATRLSELCDSMVKIVGMPDDVKCQTDVDSGGALDSIEERLEAAEYQVAQLEMQVRRLSERL